MKTLADRTTQALLKQPALAFEVLTRLLPKVIGPWVEVSATRRERRSATGQVMGYVTTRFIKPRTDEVPMWIGVVYPNLRGPAPHPTEIANASEMFLSEAETWVNTKLTTDGYVLG